MSAKTEGGIDYCAAFTKVEIAYYFVDENRLVNDLNALLAHIQRTGLCRVVWIVRRQHFGHDPLSASNPIFPCGYRGELSNSLIGKVLNTLNTSFSIAAWTRLKFCAASNANEHITLEAHLVSRYIFRI